MPPKYKLVYFPVTARAEMTRLMFAAAGVDYEDYRIKWEDWKKLKPGWPQHQLPILEIDGKVTLVQSLTIARYIARELNFYGKNNLEKAYIDQILDTIQDLAIAATPYILEKHENKAKKAELTKKFREEDAVKFLGFFEKAIADFGQDGFAVSSSTSLLYILQHLSVADFTLHAFLDFLGLQFLLDKFPKVAASFKKVEENDNVAKWLKERPDNVYHPDFGPISQT